MPCSSEVQRHNPTHLMRRMGNFSAAGLKRSAAAGAGCSSGAGGTWAVCTRYCGSLQQAEGADSKIAWGVLEAAEPCARLGASAGPAVLPCLTPPALVRRRRPQSGAAAAAWLSPPPGSSQVDSRCYYHSHSCGATTRIGCVSSATTVQPACRPQLVLPHCTHTARKHCRSRPPSSHSMASMCGGTIWHHP